MQAVRAQAQDVVAYARIHVRAPLLVHVQARVYALAPALARAEASYPDDAARTISPLSSVCDVWADRWIAKFGHVGRQSGITAPISAAEVA
ncbi:MAG: hypothetical protein CVT47_04210 [Thermoplasmata archaeon HGW-Thermoplasmata-2]|nr:MAG: hypothetical protein CVT47_04210 [Thermoplasmata archaeon HGW-Thermoplasmata-2]